MKNVFVPLFLLPTTGLKEPIPGCVGVLPVFSSREEALHMFPDTHVSECIAKREVSI